MLVAPRVPGEQASHEGDQRDALELGSALGLDRVFLVAKERLEAMRVAQRFRGERRHHLAEAHVRVRERFGVAVGAEEDRADHGALPPDRDDDDRPHVAHVERRLDAAQLRVVGGVGDEYRLAALERPLELRVPVQVDDQIPDRRILVARDEAYLVVRAGQEDRAPIEAERFPQFAGDRLEDVDEVE